MINPFNNGRPLAQSTAEVTRGAKDDGAAASGRTAATLSAPSPALLPHAEALVHSADHRTPTETGDGAGFARPASLELELAFVRSELAEARLERDRWIARARALEMALEAEDARATRHMERADRERARWLRVAEAAE